MDENLKSKFDGANLGGLRSVRIVRLADITSMPAVSSGFASYASIQLAAGAEFQEIYFTPETGYFTEQEVRDASGIKFSKEVGLEIPKTRGDMIVALKNYENVRNAIWLTDMNEVNFLVFPLRIIRKKQIPGQISQKNGIAVILTGESTDESPELTNVP